MQVHPSNNLVDNTEVINETKKIRLQDIIGALLYYIGFIDNTVWVINGTLALLQSKFISQ